MNFVQVQASHGRALLDIEVLDHVIFGVAGAFISMRANGSMPRD